MKVRDPVCGMEFDSEEAQTVSEYEDRTHYFCAERCKELFESDPERFLEDEALEK